MDTVVDRAPADVPAGQARGRRGVRLRHRRDGRRLARSRTRSSAATSRSGGGCATSARRRRATATPASGCPHLDLKVVAHHGRSSASGSPAARSSSARDGHRGPPAAQERRRGDARRRRPTRSTRTPASRPWASPIRPPRASCEHREAYEHVGEITVWVRDLHAAWDEEQGRTRVFVEANDAIYTVRGRPPGAARDRLGVPDVAGSPAAVAARGDPRRRGDGTGGRRGVGTTNHCIHGKDAIVEEILDWRPYEYWTHRIADARAGRPEVHADVRVRGPTGDADPARPPRSCGREAAKDRGDLGRWSSRSSTSSRWIGTWAAHRVRSRRDEAAPPRGRVRRRAAAGRKSRASAARYR